MSKYKVDIAGINTNSLPVLKNELGVSQAQVSRLEKSAINNVKRLIK